LFAAALNAIDSTTSADIDIVDLIYQATIRDGGIIAPTQYYDLDHLRSGLDGIGLTNIFVKDDDPNQTIQSVDDLRFQLTRTGFPVFVVGSLADNDTGPNSGYMGGNLDIAHWLIVTGVADDGTVRVINSINQRVEYYTQIEFEATMEGQRQRQNINNPDFIFGLMSVT
jgi:hypothetical protein